MSISSFDIRDYIQVYDIDLPNDFLETLIYKYDTSFEYAKIGGTTGNGTVNTSVRNCLTAKIEDQYICDIIYRYIDKCIHKYQTMFPQVSIQKNDNGYVFLKYIEGCYYKEHIDQATTIIQRILTIIILLNDDYCGGDLVFFNNTYTVPLRKNTLVIFPSSFIFPHQVLEITNGIRYSIVTWVY